VVQMLQLEWKHSLNRLEFKLVFLLMMLISVGSFIFSCFYEWGGGQYGSSLLHVRSAFEMSIIQGTGVSVLLSTLVFLSPLLAMVVYSDTAYSDQTSGVYKPILTRISVKTYLWCKAAVVSVVTFFTFFVPLLINQLLSLIAFPLQGYDNNYALPPYDIGIQNYDSGWMFDLIRLQSPLLYNLLYMFIISLFAVIIALFAFTVFLVVKKNRFAVISGVFILIVIVQLIVMIMGSFQYAFVNLLTPGSGSLLVLIGWMAFFLVPSLSVIAWQSKRGDFGIHP
jgi:hypothetical protein